LCLGRCGDLSQWRAHGGGTGGGRCAGIAGALSVCRGRSSICQRRLAGAGRRRHHGAPGGAGCGAPGPGDRTSVQQPGSPAGAGSGRARCRLAAGRQRHRRCLSATAGGGVMPTDATFQPLSHRPMRRVRTVHMVGIGGAGMAGIARVLLNLGYTVTGSDMADSPSVQALIKMGASVAIGHDADHIAEADVVVVSTAVAADNPEVAAARDQLVPVVPRAEMLAELMRFRYGIAVAGTHGKTTTTSLVASLLAAGDLDPTFVVGGRVLGADSNARLGEGPYLVAEADESDASFLMLTPMMAIVTNIDADHLDTYEGEFSRLIDAFIEFLHHLPFYGLAVLCVDDPVVRDMLPRVGRPIRTYGIDESADVQAGDIRSEGHGTRFTLSAPGIDALDVFLSLPGAHNVRNALAAVAV